MATSNELYIPSSPSKFGFRPLSKGMVTTETTMSMPDGSFLEVNGFDVTTKGPKKHGGWAPALFQYGTSTPLQFTSLDSSERIESQTQLFLADGTTLELLITNRAVYIVDEVTGYTRLNWMQSYTVDTVSQTSTETTVTIAGDFREHYVEATNSVVFGGADYPITNATATETELTLVFTGVPTIVSTDLIEIFKPFASGGAQFVDYTHARNVLYFVDGTTQMIWKFDGTSDILGVYHLEAHIITGLDGTLRTIMGACSVTAFGDRLYFAGVFEQDSSEIFSFYRNRVRWTEVLNHAKSLSANYQDLIRTTGKLVKILGMGSLIMAYLDDSIYYGRATSLTSLPYAFTYIESANVTAVGMKAVSTYFDGQVFQGYDNVYYISSSVEISAIASAITDEIRSRSSVGYMSQMLVDPERSRLILCTSTEDDILNTAFLYNYKSKAWSMNDSVQFQAPIHQANNDFLYYNELPVDDTYETTPLEETEFRALMGGSNIRNLYVFMNGYFMEYRENLGLNQFVIGGVTQPAENPCELITPDFDFDDPDTDKTALRVSLKISDDPGVVRTNNLYFLVDGSRDRGFTWKALGRMRILPGRDEDALNFRLSGSTLRFRFRQGFEAEGTSTDVVPFTISEIVLRLRERSIEAQRSNAREA